MSAVGLSAGGSRGGLYARVSSEQQAQQNTIASQLEALQQRIQQDGIVLESRLRCLEMRIITGFGEGVGGGLPAESAEAEAARRVVEFFLDFSTRGPLTWGYVAM